MRDIGETMLLCANYLYQNTILDIVSINQVHRNYLQCNQIDRKNDKYVETVEQLFFLILHFMINNIFV